MYSEKTNKRNKIKKAVTSFLLFSFLFTQLLAIVPVSVSANNVEQLPVCDPTVNLVKNGSFENPVINNSWDIFSSIPNWSIDWLAGPNSFEDATRPSTPFFEIQKNVDGWLPAEGIQYAELDTDWGGPSNDSLYGEPASVTIWQNIETVSGVTYKLSFDFSARPSTPSSDNMLEVKWNNSSVGSTMTASGESISNTNWDTHTFEILADSNNTELRFTDLGTPNSLGTFIDNVSVTCVVPEVPPNTYCPDGGDISYEKFLEAKDAGLIDFSINPSTNSATAVISNETGCTIPMSLSSYKVFDPLPKLSTQQLFDRTDLVSATSSTTFEVSLPDCMAQIDLWYGLAPTTLLDSNPYGNPPPPVVIDWAFTNENNFCLNGPTNAPICLIPSSNVDSLDDTTKEEIGAPYIPSELTIGEIIENAGYLGVDVLEDQTQYQIWQSEKDNTSINVKFLDEYTAQNFVFGYYQKGDVNSFVPVFRSGEVAEYASTDEFVKGQDINLNIENLDMIGFAIFTGSGKQLFTTENSLNGGEDHTLVYHVDDNKYILGFEDLPLGNSDKDYQDVAVLVTVLSCSFEEENTPPTINLIGANPLQLILGSDFTDPGATATDTEDGDLTSEIIVDGTVATTTLGTYTLTYSVYDSEGLGATTTREVIVYEENNPPVNTPPVVILIGDDPLEWELNTPFVDPGATYTDAEDDDDTLATTTTGTVDTAVVGPYILTYSVYDSGGLGATTTREVNVVETPVVPPVTPPSGGGGGGIGGHRRDISNLLAPQGEILGATSCLYLIDYVKIDWKNDPIEVLKVQSFLNVFEDESLSLTGIYNQATFDAVARFQTKYASDILTPWGDNVTTGFVYILTKKKINEIYCNTLYPISQADQNEIDSFRTFGQNNPNVVGGNSNTGYIFAPDNASNVLYNNNSTKVDGSDSPVVKLKDNASTSDSILKNVAVSLFAFPKKIFTDRGAVSVILLLILIAAIVTVARLFAGSGPKSGPDGNSPISPIAKKDNNKKDAPVIILPGVLPDEEIIIENPEEGLDEIIDDLPAK